MSSKPTPRILLVEDDPVSREFLAIAVQAVPSEVDSVDSLAAALALARTQDYALWLLDANLPDGNGADLLASLRCRYPGTPALAHTATGDADVLDALLGAGFLEVLVKPLPAVAVQDAVRRALGLPREDISNVVGTTAGDRPVWDDDAAALALNGNRAHIAILRGLFVDELPRLRGHVDMAVLGGDFEGVREVLHKLRASCGFVGAARLGEEASDLHRHADSAALLARFNEAVDDTLATVAADRDQPAPSSD